MNRPLILSRGTALTSRLDKLLEEKGISGAETNQLYLREGERPLHGDPKHPQEGEVGCQDKAGLLPVEEEPPFIRRGRASCRTERQNWNEDPRSKTTSRQKDVRIPRRPSPAFTLLAISVDMRGAEEVDSKIRKETTRNRARDEHIRRMKQPPPPGQTDGPGTTDLGIHQVIGRRRGRRTGIGVLPNRTADASRHPLRWGEEASILQTDGVHPEPQDERTDARPEGTPP